MNNEELAEAIAKGIIETGVEGGYDALSCSTAGDYPSMGVSQWEGINGRGDILLSYIDGGEQFKGRTYSDIVANDQESELKALLSSEQGQAAQNMILKQDCLDSYMPALLAAGLTDDRCIIYSGIWCPTSTEVVRVFISNRLKRGFNINNLETLRTLFFNEYAHAADCDDYLEGYQNRAIATYDYVATL